jgi:hypothetical protein
MPANFQSDDMTKSFKHKGKLLFDLGDGRFYERKVTKFRPKGQRFYWRYAECCICGKNTLRSVSDISKRGEKLTCSKKCWIFQRSGKNHHAWKEKTEKVRSNGKTALRIWMPNHPKAHHGRIYEHRAVMEKKIGRMLESHEVVHHIDCDPHNNDPSNLSLLANGRAHLLAHGSLNLCVKELLKKNILGFDDLNKRYFLICS